jgi:hypothetical protein
MPSVWQRMGERMGYALRIDSDTLDVATARELLDAVAHTKLGRLRALDLSLGRQRLELRMVSPATTDEWLDVEAGLVAVSTWLARRWPSSYRS